MAIKATIREALRRNNVAAKDLTDDQRARAEAVSTGSPDLKGKEAVEFILSADPQPGPVLAQDESQSNGASGSESTPNPEPSPDLLGTAKEIAKATQLDGADAVITAKSGREAKIMFDGRALAFVSLNRKGIRVHVQHHTKPQHRETVETVAGAAELVLTSERRSPKQASA